MISQELCARVLQRAMSTGADFAELFTDHTVSTAISMIDSRVDGVKSAVVSGAAVRVYLGLRSVMATTVDKSEAGLLRCAEQAAEALGQGSAPMDIVLREQIFPNIHPVKIVPSSVRNLEKTAILKDAYFAARDYDPAVRQVTGTLADKDRRILIANSEGLYAQDRQIATRLSISAVAEKENGTSMGLEMFSEIDPRSVGLRAAKQAVTMAGAGYCPAKVMPVAIESGFGGVIFHEACGHSLEASSVAYGRSLFADKLGKPIANSKVTAIDDGTIPNAWGSMNIDDEGMPAQRNVLIENGILKGYMIDRFNARRMGMAPTGSGRRQSYAYTPTSRMTNTYIAPGTDRNEDIISSIDFGLYAKSMGGGPEILMNIDMVGTELDMGQGMCGSSSGSIPTNVGQPLIRVSSITVGGR